MKSDAKLFLESGLLEEYLLGLASDDQVEMIEQYIRDYPEVRAEYEAMQRAMQQLAREQGVADPKKTKEAVMVGMGRIPAKKGKPANVSIPKGWAIAAGLAALFFVAAAFYHRGQAEDARAQNRRMAANLEQFGQAAKGREAQCRTLENQLRLLSDPNTAKFMLQGNQKAPGLQIAAYWNEAEQQSCLNLVALPDPPRQHCFQLWADVDGEMVNLGVLPASTGEVVAIPFKINAESLNITIEPAGGSEHPTVAELVASVAM